MGHYIHDVDLFVTPIAERQIKFDKKKALAEGSFDLPTSGLWAQHASTAPLCCPSLYAEKKYFVRSGIRTHALRRGLRPERSALDHSAILTSSLCWVGGGEKLLLMSGQRIATTVYVLAR